jgi:hypothetical protein
MAVFDLAETSTVLGILCTQVTFELSDCCAFGRCPWFHTKPSVSAIVKIDEVNADRFVGNTHF